MSDDVLILLVDDDSLVQAVLHEVLEDGGYTVEAASSGQEALNMLEAASGSYAAVVTDVNLGSKISGWEIAKRARERSPDIPVVYMSGYAESEWTARGVPRSVMLGKPFAPAQLLTAVSVLLTTGLPG